MNHCPSQWVHSQRISLMSLMSQRHFSPSNWSRPHAMMASLTSPSNTQPAVHWHRCITRIKRLPKNHLWPSIQKYRPTACSPVPFKVLASQVFNKIGSITAQPSDPYQFGNKAKPITVDAVSCLAHAINSHLDKGCNSLKHLSNWCN